MASSSKIAKACKAMKTYGIPEKAVKQVLNSLLDLYDKNWNLIEDENYRVLVDAIFEIEESRMKREEKKQQDSWLTEEPEEYEPPLKRYRLRSQREQSPSSHGKSSAIAKCSSEHIIEEPLIIGERKPIPLLKGRKSDSSREGNNESDNVSTQPYTKDDREKSVSLQIVQRKKRLVYGRGTQIISWNKPNVKCDEDLYPDDNVVDDGAINLKDEPFDESLLHFEATVSKLPPEYCSLETTQLDGCYGSPLPLIYEGSYSNDNCSCSEGNDWVLVASEHVKMDVEEDAAPHPSQLDIASSSNGVVKVSLINNPSQNSEFCVRRLDSVLKQVEETYVKSYRISEPGFSLATLRKDMCECFSVEHMLCMADRQVKATSQQSLVELNKSNLQPACGCNIEWKRNLCFPSMLSNGSIRLQNLIEVLPQIPKFRSKNILDFLHNIIGLNINEAEFGARAKRMKAFKSLQSSNSRKVMIVQRQDSSGSQNSPHYIEDISQGQENIKISLVNEITSECQPCFKYISRNAIYRGAYVKFLLARISDENCCSNCSGNCLLPDIPCTCAGETGEIFAFTPKGLIEENFLEKCISMNRDPQLHNLVFCQDCPLERSKDKGLSGKCKGHLVRPFIKECWYKCGCSKSCGNRVVQRGISVKLQVFMTLEGKGWGLRTLEDIPKGAFVCEYVGEIVTNTELFERNTQSTDSKHTYPVLLDADWSSERVLKDEEALCLDATFYGNVARFINHRCFDANLVEIPVEVESPDRHYYHLAFFTSRQVNALEELTWDYGIDFDDHSHPVKAFQCHCGSKYCRGTRHRKRARRSH